MRCYLMKKGHIADVEILASGPDESLVDQAKLHFARRGGERFDGFEVWDRARKVYVWPEEPSTPPSCT